MSRFLSVFFLSMSAYCGIYGMPDFAMFSLVMANIYNSECNIINAIKESKR